MSSNPPLLVGITGGIGTGKSLVCHTFRALGIPVYEADSRARILQETNKELVNAISTLFGEESYENGKLNRKHIADQVFSDKSKLEKLNNLVHPKVQQDFEDWTKAHGQHPFVLKEAALIFETGGHKKLDYVITVASEEDERIQRIKKRDPFRTEQEIRNIIDRQLPQSLKIKQSDFVLQNHEASPLLNQVLELVEKLHFLAKK